jgi:hypothetical protein
MIWWSLIVVCHAANLRDTTLSMKELKETTASPITFRIFTPYQNYLTYTLDTEDLVSTLKKAVQKEIGWWPSDQIISYHGEVLADDRTLGSYGVIDEDVFALTDPPL